MRISRARCNHLKHKAIRTTIGIIEGHEYARSKLVDFYAEIQQWLIEHDDISKQNSGGYEVGGAGADYIVPTYLERTIDMSDIQVENIQEVLSEHIFDLILALKSDSWVATTPHPNPVICISTDKNIFSILTCGSGRPIEKEEIGVVIEYFSDERLSEKIFITFSNIDKVISSHNLLWSLPVMGVIEVKGLARITGDLPLKQLSFFSPRLNTFKHTNMLLSQLTNIAKDKYTYCEV